MRHVLHKDIDKVLWDRCIEHSQLNIVYAKSWFLDTVSPKWNALILGNYDAVMPLTWRRKLGVTYLFQPHFCQQLGVFYTNKTTEEDVVCQFLSCIPEKYKFIEINLNSCNYRVIKQLKIPIRDTLTDLEPEIWERKNHELQLNKPYDKLFKAFSQNTQRNIIKSKESNYAISSKLISLKKVIDLFQANKREFIHGLDKTYFSMLKQLVKNCPPDTATQLVSIHSKNRKTMAGALFLETENRTIFLFSGNTVQGKRSNAMHLLIDNYINQNQNQKKRLDFEGSDNMNLARFYRSFGAEESLYLRFKINRLPKIVKWLKP